LVQERQIAASTKTAAVFVLLFQPLKEGKMNTSDKPLDSRKVPEQPSQFQSPITEPLWTVEDVAQYLKLEPETVRAMARTGKLPAIKIGKVWRFKKSALNRALYSAHNGI
jgi:excisionase family DNA binding protein